MMMRPLGPWRPGAAALALVLGLAGCTEPGSGQAGRAPEDGTPAAEAGSKPPEAAGTGGVPR